MDNEATTSRALRMRLGIGAGVVLILALAAAAVLIGALSPHGATATASPPRLAHTVSTARPSAGDSPTAFVHVVGQVKNPGLYELAAGSRIVDAVSAAGGFTPAADQTQLNLAQTVQDGQQVVVLAQGAIPASLDTAGIGAVGGSQVDINTADATALQTLDGIGPALAQRILTYRSAHGGFRTVNDLQNVPGIGPKKFAAIRAKVST